MKLSVIILNYSTYKMTLNLVNQLRCVLTDIDSEIVVVDNASPNESGFVLSQKSRELGFTFIQNSTNLGYSAGNNVGLRHSQKTGAEYALILNNDIFIENASDIIKMMNLMDSNRNIGACSPIIISPIGEVSPPTYPIKPSFWNLSFGIFAFNRKRYSFNLMSTCRVYAPRGSCMLLNNAALNEIDNLDEKTFLYYEEPILAERLISKGYECWHCGEAKVIHNHSATISTHVKKVQLSGILCKSYRYYLSEYRKMNRFLTVICIAIRKLAIIWGGAEEDNMEIKITVISLLLTCHGEKYVKEQINSF